MLKGFIVVSYILGIICAAMAILRSRTPQGATAWVMSLLSFPFITVPIYILMGKNKFEGYGNRRRILDRQVLREFERLNAIRSEYLASSEEMKMIAKLVSPKNQPGFTLRNSIKLLINSDEVYPEMLEAMKAAKFYIIFQFYVVRGDDTGRMFFNVLIQKAREGIHVTFMNDAIGVVVPKDIMTAMIDAGVEIGTFNQSTKKGKLQINFRNHRKIVVIDGEIAFLGGLNIGDEYAGLKKKYGRWRDTAVRIEGPSVIAAQLASAKDWYCIHEKSIKANWNIRPAKDNAAIMVLHSGPADAKYTLLLSFIALINAATERLWIANPYYVPPESLMDAILLASLRGVEVKILLPGYSDAHFVMLASRVYQKKLLQHGIKIFRYSDGFLHQKVMIIDNHFAVVGSANLDCRSMFINFEVSVITTDQKFISECSQMLASDFSISQQVEHKEFQNLSLTERIITQGANLLAPVL